MHVPWSWWGDLNLHLDVTLNPSAVRFQTVIESYGLLQHISSPTHRARHNTRRVHHADGHSGPRRRRSAAWDVRSFIHHVVRRSSVTTRPADKQHPSTSVAWLQLRPVLHRFKLVVVALRPSTWCRWTVHLLSRHSAGACWQTCSVCCLQTTSSSNCTMVWSQLSLNED